MTLDKEDLKAIEAVVERTVDAKLEAKLKTTLESIVHAIVWPMIENLEERVAAGFLAVDEQFARVWREFDRVNEKIDRIERIQLAETERNDHQDLAINCIRTNLHAV